MSELPELYGYTDYRAYLLACYWSKRASRRGWSYTVWAKQLGLGSASTLVMIIKGQRNPGPALIESLVAWLKLGPERAEYFRDLVRLEKYRRDPFVSSLLLERLARLRRVDALAQLPK